MKRTATLPLPPELEQAINAAYAEAHNLLETIAAPRVPLARLASRATAAAAAMTNLSTLANAAAQARRRERRP
jgi:hypothetical protein